MKGNRAFNFVFVLCLAGLAALGCNERRSQGEKPTVAADSAAKAAESAKNDSVAHVEQTEEFPGGVQPDDYKAQKLVNQLTNYMMAVCSEQVGCPKDLDAAKEGVKAQFKLRWPDDPWGHPYVYKYISDTKFEITSMGADGQDGTKDDVHASKKNQ